MRVELMFPSRYLAAADIIAAGKKEVVVTIEKIYRDELRNKDGGTEPCWIVKLVGKEKLWVLKKTSALIIAGMYGPEGNDWIGKSLTLYPARVQAFGKIVDALRPRDTIPQTRSGGNGGKAQRGGTSTKEPPPVDEDTAAMMLAKACSAEEAAALLAQGWELAPDGMAVPPAGWGGQ